MKKWAFIFALGFLLISGAHGYADTADFQATVSIGDHGFASPSSYYIDIHVISDGSEKFKLGDCRFKIKCNTAALSAPTLSLQNPDFNTGDYAPMTVSVGGDYIVFKVDHSGGGGSDGIYLPNSDTRLARITLHIDDPDQTSEFSFWDSDLTNFYVRGIEPASNPILWGGQDLDYQISLKYIYSGGGGGGGGGGGCFIQTISR